MILPAIVSPIVSEIGRWSQASDSLRLSPAPKVDIDFGNPDSVTYTSGVVSGVKDNSGNGFDFTVAGSGTDLSYNAARGCMIFGAGKYLSNTSNALKALLSAATNKTIIIIGKATTSPSAMSAILSCVNSGTDKLTIGHRSNNIRMSILVGATHQGAKSIEHIAPTLKSVIEYGWNGTAATAYLNNGAMAGSLTPYPGSGTGTSIGAQPNGLLPFSGEIYRVLIFDKVLTAQERESIYSQITTIITAVGVGQSNEELKDSITSPHNRDGTFSFGDKLSQLSIKNIGNYINCAISGSNLSKKAYDAAGETDNNYLVNDTTTPITAGTNLTALKAKLTSLGITSAHKLRFSFTGLESEAYQIKIGGITKAEGKTALQWLVDDLLTAYPNSTFHIQIIGRHNNSFDDAIQPCREIELEIIEENPAKAFYSSDVSYCDLKGADTQHYTPESYAELTKRFALSAIEGIAGADFLNPTINSNVIRLPYKHNHGSAFTNKVYLPYNNLISTGRDFNSWNKGGVTVTSDTTTGADGEASQADTITKSVAETTKFLSRTFSTNAGLHSFEIYLNTTASLTQNTILITGNNAATRHARLNIDLSAKTITDDASTNLIDYKLTNIYNNWLRVNILTELTTVTDPRIYFYMGLYNSIATGTTIADMCSIYKADEMVTGYTPQNGGKSFFRVFVNTIEVIINNIVDTGEEFLLYLASAPASGATVDIYGLYGDLRYLQQNTIPRDNSPYRLPAKAFKKTITA